MHLQKHIGSYQRERERELRREGGKSLLAYVQGVDPYLIHIDRPTTIRSRLISYKIKSAECAICVLRISVIVPFAQYIMCCQEKTHLRTCYLEVEAMPVS